MFEIAVETVFLKKKKNLLFFLFKIIFLYFQVVDMIMSKIILF
jgi:hypothetical protein